ncbi:MAG: tripartite tricarboxylate transporter substrate binding protein [Pseudomonadota bacterium]
MPQQTTGQGPQAPVVRRMALAVMAAGAAGTLVPAWAQAGRYPNKAIRIVVPFAAGGTIDTESRPIIDLLSKELGQPIYLDARPGANGVLGTDIVAHAPPDGYTLMLVTQSFTVNPAIYRKLPYDPVRDLTPVTSIAKALGLVLIMHPSVQAKTVQELVALSQRSELNYSTPGVGNTLHLCMELFKQRTGARITHVPYKGSSLALNAVVANEVQMEFTPLGLAAQFIKAGRLKALATSGSERLADLPDVPTMAESGVKDMVFYGSWIGMFCPSATPREVVDKLYTTIAAILQRPAVRDAIASNGSGHLADGRSPAEFRKQVTEDFATFAEAVKAAGIQPE